MKEEKKAYCRKASELDANELGLPEELVERVNKHYGNFYNCLNEYRRRAVYQWDFTPWVNGGNLLLRDERIMVNKLSQMFHDSEVECSMEECMKCFDLWEMLKSYDLMLAEAFMANGFIRKDFDLEADDFNDMFFFVGDIFDWASGEGKDLFEVWLDTPGERFADIYETVPIITSSKIIEKILGPKLTPAQYEILKFEFTDNHNDYEFSVQERDLLDKAIVNAREIIQEFFWMKYAW